MINSNIIKNKMLVKRGEGLYFLKKEFKPMEFEALLLGHPNIIPIKETPQGYILPLARWTLAGILGEIPRDQIRRIMWELGKSLEFLHEHDFYLNLNADIIVCQKDLDELQLYIADLSTITRHGRDIPHLGKLYLEIIVGSRVYLPPPCEQVNEKLKFLKEVLPSDFHDAQDILFLMLEDRITIQDALSNSFFNS